MSNLAKSNPRIQASDMPSAERISILLPVLNEAKRIPRALESLIAQPEEIQEILVVDGGSSDGTQSIVASYRAKDPRVQLIDASPVDPKWTGKAWGLKFGLQRSHPNCQWILCVDADVGASPMLARSLLHHAKTSGVSTFSVATRQHLSGNIEAMIHPAMLTTLVYRFGAPGRATRNPHKVQANGQCFSSRRRILLETSAFDAARSSLCEDITIARRLAECGETVGFYEADSLVDVSMYDDWREAWNNWPRSLPMRDQYFGWREAVGLLAVVLCQGLALPVFVLALTLGAPVWLIVLSGLLTMLRIGVLFGVARAYPKKPWTYWLSPLFDLPVTLRIVQYALRRRHSWRGRTYVRRKGGVFEPLL
ncbi:MAG: glycosyltransferase [Candidatus Binatia bacterium]